MSPETKTPVILLAVCAAADLIAAPGLIASSGDDGSMLAFGIVTGLIGIATVIAAVGLARGAAWAKPLAIGGRALDILTALPGFGAGMPAPVIVSAVIVLSLVTLAVVLKVRTPSVTPAY